MADPQITDYKCSACGADLTSEGTQAFDHMVAEHGFDPENDLQVNSLYLIPTDSNPTLTENNLPER
jgi:hypothetical protein